MRRLGMMKEECEKVCQLFQNNSQYIKVIGLMSHCFDSSSYSIENPTTQQEIFKDYYQLTTKYFKNIIQHIIRKR
jgi:alanine racemase